MMKKGAQSINSIYLQEKQSQILYFIKYQLQQRMLMIFIWLGSLLPKQYQSTIRDCQEYSGNRCFLLQDFHFNFYLQKYKSLINLPEQRLNNLTLSEKTDLLRLLYLHSKGGIYADIQYQINYSCLEKFFENVKESLIFNKSPTDSTINPDNNFLYSSMQMNPKIQEVLKKIKQCEDCKGQNFASLKMFENFEEASIDISKCMKKNNVFSWRENATSNLNDYILPNQTRDYENCLSQRQNIKEQLSNSSQKLSACYANNQTCFNNLNLIQTQLESLNSNIKNISEDLLNCQISFNESSKQIKKSKSSTIELFKCKNDQEEKKKINSKSKIILNNKKVLIQNIQICQNSLKQAKKSFDSCNQTTFHQSKQFKDVIELTSILVNNCQNSKQITYKDWIIISSGIMMLLTMIILVKIISKAINNSTKSIEIQSP